MGIQTVRIFHSRETFKKMDLLQVSSQMDSDSEETVSNVSDLDQLSPIMASVSVSGQNKDKNDLLVIKQMEEQAENIQKSDEETTNLFRGLLGKSTATTVATIQTMRDAAHEVGEISDAVVRESYTLMSQLEEINVRMISLHNSRKQIQQINDLLDVLDTKLSDL